MAVAGALRSRPTLGLWQTAWRAGERTQWQQARQLSNLDQRTYQREKKKTLRTSGAQVSGETMGSDQQYQILLPATWVRPPLSRFPRSPSYLYNYLKIKAIDVFTRLSIRFSSKPTFLKPALYKPSTSKLIPVAKALHRTMYDALARGDKDTLKRVCGIVLRDRFDTIIEARKPGQRFTWELVRYNKAVWRYPRIVDHKVAPLQPDARVPNRLPPIMRQVTVAIASRQRRVEYDYSRAGGGKVVPGSEKEVDVVENVVLSCTLNRKTFVASDWKIISLIGEMTPEKWAGEQAFMKEMQMTEQSRVQSKLKLKA